MQSSEQKESNMNNKQFDIDADYETVVVELAVYPDSRGVRRDTYGFIELARNGI